MFGNFNLKITLYGDPTANRQKTTLRV